MNRQAHVLFLCVANSARSQLAEGLAKEILGHLAIIESAGSNPSGIVHPLAIDSLREIGIDISKNISKSIGELSPSFMEHLDYVVTLCAEEVCPHLPTQAKRLHWPLRDPAASNEAEMRKAFYDARVEISERINVFKKRHFRNSEN